MLKVWLDDERPAPEGWVWVKDTDLLKKMLVNGGIAQVSLDHDLGTGMPDGSNLINWMEEQGIWPPLVIIHTANPVAGRRMYQVAARYTTAQFRPFTAM